MGIADRSRAEVADAGLNIEASIGLDDHQTVEADGTADEDAGGHTHAAYLVTALLRERHALIPFELFLAAVERFLNIGAGDVGALAGFIGGTHLRLAFGTVEAVQRDLIDAEFARGLGENRLHQRDALIAARLALRDARRSIGQDSDAAPADGLRLVHERDHAAGSGAVALRIVGSVIHHDEAVNGGDFAFLSEADFEAAMEAGARAADEMLFLAADAHHDRRTDLLRHDGRDDGRDGAGDFAAETAAGVFADHDDVVGVDLQPARERRNGLRRTLRRAVDKDLAILPVSHRGPRFETLVAGVGRDEGLIENEVCLFQAFLDVAEYEFGVGSFAHGQLAVIVVGKVGFGPLDFFDFGGRGGLAGRDDGANPDVAFDAGVGATGPETDERIDHVRQALDIELDFFDGVGGGEFVYRADGKDGFALINGVAGKPALAEGVGGDADAHVSHGVGRFRHVVDRHDGFDAGHGQGFGHVDGADVAVRDRAEEQLAEEHALGAIVFGVFGAARDFGDQIGRLIILADQLIVGVNGQGGVGIGELGHCLRTP